MPGNFKREDLRIIKTRNALYSAMLVLLKRSKFNKITVNDICVEALVSRTAFYAHFKDKYDLLSECLADLRKRYLGGDALSEKHVADIICKTLQTQYVAIINLLEDMDEEQQSILLRFMAETAVNSGIESEPVFMDFIVGGVLNVLYCYVRNRRKMGEEFTKNIVDYIYKLIHAMINWNSSNIADSKDLRGMQS